MKEGRVRSAQDKVLQLDALAARVAASRAAGRQVVHCHGCFDILHLGHLRHFEAARALGDELIVTVTPDEFVNKGPGRPVFTTDQRCELIAGLAAVDWVAPNRWASAVDTINLVRASVFIKGQEYEQRAMQVNPNFVAEAAACAEVGCVVAFTHEDVSSSTAAIERLRAAGSPAAPRGAS